MLDKSEKDNLLKKFTNAMEKEKASPSQLLIMLEQIYKALGSKTRLKILTSLLENDVLAFTELSVLVGLDPRTNTGTLGYHVKKLVDGGWIQKLESTGKYALTPMGEKAVTWMDNPTTVPTAKILHRIKHIKDELIRLEKMVSGGE